MAQLQALNVATKGGEFTQLFIPGFHSSMTEGAPELPQMNRLIALPAGGNASVDVTNLRTRTVRLADHGLTNPLFPHQPSLSKSQSIDEVPFVYDAAAYARARVENELVSVEYLGRMRAVDVARRWMPSIGVGGYGRGVFWHARSVPKLGVGMNEAHRRAQVRARRARERRRDVTSSIRSGELRWAQTS